MINTKSFFKTFLLALGLMLSTGMWAEAICDLPTGHLGDANFGDANGRILLSLEPTGNANEYKMTIKPNYANGATKKLDYVYVIAGGNNPYPAEAGHDEDGNEYDELSVTFTNANSSTSFTIQWSNPGWGGRWQYEMNNVELTSLTSCSGGEQGGGEQGGGEQGGEPSQEPEAPSVIDWSSIAWIANSSDKFKIGAADDENLPNVVEVQQPGWAAKRGIYLTFPAADITCSRNHAVQGAGMILYTDQFIAKETLVTVNYAGGSKTFVVFYKDGIDFSTPAPAYSEYCNYSGPQTTQDGKACSITWVTNDNGDVVITLSDGPVGGYTGVSFRGDCFEGEFDKFKVISEANGIENASVYFTRERSAAENYYILRKNATALPAGKIVIWTNATLAWKSNENASRWQNGELEFSYTYGTTCPTLDAPTNVAVADNGTITFDAVVGAEKYVAHVFNGVKEVYNSEVTNGGVIDYHVYEATTLTVKLEAVTGGMSSDLSDAATWNIAVSPLPASIWCETAGVATAKNNWGDAHFTINTLPNGNVLIEITSPDGTAANFRGGAEKKGMNGTFKLNGSTEDFSTFFDVVKAADNKTVTLTLKNMASKPALGSVIDYSGQIECATSQNGDDWSNYDVKGYLYGTKCPDVAVSGVALDKTAAELPMNKTLTLTATVAPFNATNQEVTWTSSNDAIATVVDGVVTPVAVGGPVTITARTEDGGFTATCAVTVTAALATEPTSAPENPTYAADKVRAIYSATYETTCNHGAWGGSQSFTKEEYGIKVVLNPGNGYVGFVDFPARNCATMEYFHADVWVADDASMRFIPITGQTERGVTKNLTGAQWNSIDIALNEGDWARTTDWTNVFQIKIDQAAGLTFWINNIYFYTTSEDDVTKPVMTSATLESTSYMSAIINVAATDDRGVTKYVVKNGATEMGKYTPAAGKITVTGLTDGTAYTLSIYAEDAAENMSDNKVDVELTTLALPAAAIAPNVAGKEYRSVYAPSLTNMLKHDFVLANWGSATGTKVDAKGYIFYHTTNNATVVWGENNAGGNAIVAADAYKGSKGGLDASEMEYMHVDIWADKAGCNSLVIVINDHNLGAAQTLNAGWNSLDIALSEFAATPDNNYLLDNVAWIKFVGLNNTNDVAVTNVYFWKSTAANYSLTTEDTDFYTFYANEEVSIPAGMKAFTGVFNNGALVLTELTDVIPAQTGVLVKTEAAGTYTLEGSTTNAAAVAENSLRGVAETTPLATVVAEETARLGAAADIYVVGKKNEVVGFYKSTKTNVSAHRAYVPVTEAMKPAAGAPIRIVMHEDTATGMEDIATGENVVKFIENGTIYIMRNAHVYDMMGRLVK